MGQQSNNCSQATRGYSRLHQSTHHTVARADVEETKAKAKPKQKKTKSKRNRSETKTESQPEKNEAKMEKKAILYFAINRKNCSFYCFQSVFCFFGGVEGGVAPVIAEKVCMWQAGGRHMARAGQAMREQAKREKAEGSNIGGEGGLPACLPYLPCRWPKDITAKCYA